MQIVKSLGDGIGTAAGVAWPTFGITFGALSLTIAGSTAIVLGVVSSALFLLVAVPVSVWSYRNYLKEKERLERTLEAQLALAEEYYLSFLLIAIQEYLFENEKKLLPLDAYSLVENVKYNIFAELSNETSKLSLCNRRTLNSLLNDVHCEKLLCRLAETAINDKAVYDNTNAALALKTHLKSILVKRINYPELQFKRPTAALVRAGLSSFFAAFGSVAGCAAGTMGMLSSVGIFAGLAAVPVAGWVALGAAVAFGIVVAGICVYQTYQTEIKTQRLEQHIEENRYLETLCDLKKARLETQIEERSKYQRIAHNSSSLIRRENPGVRIRRAQSEDLSNLSKNINSIWSEPTGRSIVEVSEGIRHRIR